MVLNYLYIAFLEYDIITPGIEKDIQYEFLRVYKYGTILVKS